MNLAFRTIAIVVSAFGITAGVAFGAGVAYGRGDPKTVQSGLSQQQIQQLYGAPTNIGALQGAPGAQLPGSGTGAPPAGVPPTGGQSATNPFSGGPGAIPAARGLSGRVTGVSGQTVTIETGRGTEKLNLSASVMVNKSTAGAVADLKEGMTLFAGGTRNADGSFDASTISEITPELQTLLSTPATFPPIAPVTPDATPAGR